MSADYPKTSSEATAKLYAMFDEVQALVGGSWHVTGDSADFPCTTPDGGEGITRSSFRFTKDETVEREAVIALVVEKWQKEGYSITERDEPGPVPLHRVFAMTPEGNKIQFSAADISMTLEGESLCARDDESSE